jgi:large subunit ribosomal protein L11
MEKEVIKNFSIVLRSGKVESGPPLSTILGNFGLNTVKFVKDFNDFTKELPDYFLLVVIINVYNDKSYSFLLKEPSVSLLLRLISFDKDFLVKGSGGYRPFKYKVVNLNDIFLISFFKFGYCNDRTLRLILGTVQSMKLHVIPVK